MFVDVATILVKGGKGGNGLVSFHREKYVAAGGPDGGDGGRGGNVVFVVDDNLSTLMDFRYKRKYAAPNGQDGRAARSRGKNGEDLIVRVPRGTLIRDTASGRLIGDLSEKDSVFIAAKGGNGGWGNVRFATATRQVPNFAKPGRPGQEREVTLELKLLADVGLLGFPNVGKSTLLSVVSDARPRIANYHFTTLVPNLGVVQMGEQSMVLADIPGIIEGASEGVGLGHDFLRHIERTRLLIHMVDVSGSEGRDPVSDVDLILSELRRYSEKLAMKEQVIAANKVDVSEEYLESFTKEMENRGYKVFPISAATNKGLKELLAYVWQRLQEIPPEIFEIEEEPEIFADEDEPLFTVRRENETYVVEGEYIANLISSTNFDDSESFAFFQRSLRKNGIIEKLEAMGVKEGDTVRMDDVEFDFEY